jgi:hypothetical protein
MAISPGHHGSARHRTQAAPMHHGAVAADLCDNPGAGLTIRGTPELILYNSASAGPATDRQLRFGRENHIAGLRRVHRQRW